MEVFNLKTQKVFNKESLEKDCLEIRTKILNLAYLSGGGQHLGGGLSIVELMTYIYGFKLNLDPKNTYSNKRDRFILSKGHGVLGFYTVLNKYGFISDEILNTYKTKDSELISHPIKNLDYGIESSNGSLGHGLSFGLGIALGLKNLKIDSNVYVLIGDGECNEGSIWEAAMSGAQNNLNNLTCILDNNHFQSDGPTSEIIRSTDLSKKWEAFGWEVISINGHDLNEIHSAFSIKNKKPKLILASTIKGKGVDFMENNNLWHHGRLTESLYKDALKYLQQ